MSYSKISVSRGIDAVSIHCTIQQQVGLVRPIVTVKRGFTLLGLPRVRLVIIYVRVVPDLLLTSVLSVTMGP